MNRSTVPRPHTVPLTDYLFAVLLGAASLSLLMLSLLMLQLLKIAEMPL